MTAWWMRRTFAQRLGVGLGIMVAAIVVIAGTSFVSARAVQHNVDDIFTVRLPALDALVEADRDLQQLLVAERSTIFTDPGTELFDKFVKDYEENLRQSEERWQRYRRLAGSTAEQSVVDGYQKARDEWMALSRQVIDQRRANTAEGRKAALAMTLGEAREKFDAMRDFLNTAQERLLAQADEQYTQAGATYQRVIRMMVGLGIGSGLGAFLLAWFIGHTTSRQIRELASGLRSGAGQVVSAADEVSSSAQGLAQGASHQAATLEESSASMEEMSSMTQSTAGHADRASTLVESVARRVEESNRALQVMEASMAGIRDANGRVSKIIKTIDEIAFQTNILALNAAVEAARAGEAGMGFAVVADEVRGLAQRAAQAARDTTGLIEESLTRSNEGANSVTGVTMALRGITETFGELEGLVSQVREASRQQADGISQVSQGVSELEKTTQATAATAEEGAAASEELYAQSQHALSLVMQLEALAGIYEETGDLAALEGIAASHGEAMGDRGQAAVGDGSRARRLPRSAASVLAPLVIASAMTGFSANVARAQSSAPSATSTSSPDAKTTSGNATASTTPSAQGGQTQPPAPKPPAAPATGVHRWLDLQVGQLDARYRLVETSAGVRTVSQMQHRQTFKAGIKFDAAGRYSLQIGVGSGTNFIGSWDTTGAGTGEPDWNPNVRQLYLAAAPAKGLDLQFGGLAPVRGESTEITSYDNDGFLVGERISIKQPKTLYLDEVSLTFGHLGDTNTPNVFDRFDGLSDHDYAQALAVKKLGKRVAASMDWTHALGDDTLRQGVRVGLKETRVIDAARLEVYERITGITDQGMAISAERALTKALFVNGGYANIDRNNSTLNADRFQRGQRGFIESRYAITPELSVSVFYTRAFHNDFVVPNRTRFDFIVGYNVLKALQRSGVW